MRSIVLLLVFLVSVLGCHVPKYDSVPNGIRLGGHQTTHMSWHGDVDFTGPERLEVEKASELWEAQSGGQVVMKVTWDLDFDNISSLAERVEDNLIVRLTDEDSYAELDKAHGTVLAYTHGDYRTGDPVHIFALANRMTPDQWFRKVMLHEMGHALGSRHLCGPDSIMYYASKQSGTVCLKDEDLNEYCNFAGRNMCDSSKLRACPHDTDPLSLLQVPPPPGTPEGQFRCQTQ